MKVVEHVLRLEMTGEGLKTFSSPAASVDDAKVTSSNETAGCEGVNIEERGMRG